MYVSTDEVSLSPIPDGYRHTSSLRGPKKLTTLDFYLSSSFALAWILLASLGLIDGGIFHGSFITGLPVVLLVGFVSVSIFDIHRVIQGQVSHWLGYTVSFDFFLIPGSSPYHADPGQFQSRWDGLLIVSAPLSLFLFQLPEK